MKKFLNGCRMIFAIPVAIAIMLLFDFISPYISKLIDLIYGNNPNGLITTITDYGMVCVLFPVCAVLLASYLFGKIYPVCKSKLPVAIVLMSFIIFFTFLFVIGYAINSQNLVPVTVKGIAYIVTSIYGIYYAVKSKHLLNNSIVEELGK